METVFVKGRTDCVERSRIVENALVVVDLNAAKMEPIELVREVKQAGRRVIGFLSHVDTELREQAVEAGADRVLARSAFAQSLNRILKEN